MTGEQTPAVEVEVPEEKPKPITGRRADRRGEGRLLVAGNYYNANAYKIEAQRKRSTHKA